MTNINFNEFKTECLKELDKKNPISVVFNFVDGSFNHRIGKTRTDDLLLMRKGSKKYGSLITPHSLENVKSYSIKSFKPIDFKGEWEKSINKAILMLEKSGLWVDLLNNFKTAKIIGYDAIKDADLIYWKTDKSLSHDENKLNSFNEIKNKYPLLIKNDKINTTILWYMKNIKIKKMAFGPHYKHILDELKKAIHNKVEYNSGTIPLSYDLSVSYNPEINKAWYSEEFKGCGNGHYYLALNETHAFFYEDD